MPKIIHAADLHLDSAFGGLGPEKARERRRESRDLVDRLAELAVREGAETVLLSGDLFDGERVYPETLERLLRNELMNDKQNEKKTSQFPMVGLLLGGRREERDGL